MKSKSFNPACTDFFRNLGEPTLSSTDKMRRMQERCVARNDPNTFYQVVDHRPEPKVVWAHNTRAHFNAGEFSFNTFFGALHPFWRPIYVGMIVPRYEFFNSFHSGNSKRDLILTLNVPLRDKSNKYYWYSEVSIPGTFDSRGAVVESLGEFHRLSEFDRMIPALQRLTHKGAPVKAFDKQIKTKLSTLLDKSLRELLSPAHYKLLRAYRILLLRKEDSSRRGVAKSLGLSLQALDKRNVRLLDQASFAFPAAVLTSVVHFARFLNDFSGGSDAFFRRQVNLA